MAALKLTTLQQIVRCLHGRDEMAPLKLITSQQVVALTACNGRVLKWLHWSLTHRNKLWLWLPAKVAC
eukprot:2268846-Karenia_brevis.AAC.1